MNKPYRNLFLILLIINFCVLVYALMWAEHDTFLFKNRIIFVVSFVVIAGFARRCCKNSKKELVVNDE